jgi:resuscitation-promoting factor RpfA
MPRRPFRTRRRPGRLIILTVIAVLAAAGLQVAYSLPAQAATDDTHLLVSDRQIDGSTKLLHTIRLASGFWHQFADAEAAAGGMPGEAGDLSGTTIGQSLHALVVNRFTGDLYHTIRNGQGLWQAFGNVELAASSIPPVARVASAATSGDLHVLAVTSAGDLFHAIRFANGSWTGFGNVKAQTGNPGIVQDVAAAGFANGDVHIAVTAGAGLFHAIRLANGSWTSLSDVRPHAGNPGPTGSVAATRSGSSLHIVVKAGFGAFHTIRNPDGSWRPMQELPAIVTISDVGVAGHSDGRIKVVAISSGNGTIIHGQRFANGIWSPFEQIDVPWRAGSIGEARSLSFAGE